MQAAPGRLELLELRGVDDLVHLTGNETVDLRDAGVQHGVGIARDRDGPGEHFTDELLDHVLAALAGRRV